MSLIDDPDGNISHLNELLRINSKNRLLSLSNNGMWLSCLIEHTRKLSDVCMWLPANQYLDSANVLAQISLVSAPCCASPAGPVFFSPRYFQLFLRLRISLSLSLFSQHVSFLSLGGHSFFQRRLEGLSGDRRFQVWVCNNRLQITNEINHECKTSNNTCNVARITLQKVGQL